MRAVGLAATDGVAMAIAGVVAEGMADTLGVGVAREPVTDAVAPLKAVVV